METPILRPFFIQEIFLRLSVKSVLRLKSLNKYYYKLISSQRFKKLYLDHSIAKTDTNPSIILHDYKRLDRCDRDYRHHPHYASSTIIQCNGGGVEDQTDYTFIPANGYQMYSICSCNGLVFMSAAVIYADREQNYAGSKERLFIANPETKEYKEIATGSKGISYSLYGLGYVSGNDEYKVVRVRKVEMWMDSFEAEVYTLGGSNEWKGIGSIKYKFEGHHGVMLNGLRHWVADRWEDKSRKGEIIVAFDFVSENFVEVALPKDPLETSEDRGVTTVGELGGCLSVVSNIRHKQIDLWVMQEYGAKESWSKSFTISAEVIYMSVFGRSWSYDGIEFARPMRSFEKNNFLLQVDTSLVLYDPGNKRIRQVKVRGDEEWTDAEVYVPSLFSLKSLGSSELERPNKRQRLNSGTRFVWQRPNKRPTRRGYNVENYRTKLEEICQG